MEIGSITWCFSLSFTEKGFLKCIPDGFGGRSVLFAVLLGLRIQISWALRPEKGEYRDYVDNSVKTLKAAGGTKLKKLQIL